MTFEGWQALGEWIEGLLPWDYYATLTFRVPMTAERAIAETKDWLRTVARELVEGHLFVVYGVEAHESGGHHLHLLLHVDQNRWLLDERRLEASWIDTKYGGPMSEVQGFADDGGAGHYIVKDGAWDFFVPCPRRRGCRHSAGCLGEARFTRIIASK